MNKRCWFKLRREIMKEPMLQVMFLVRLDKQFNFGAQGGPALEAEATAACQAQK